MVLVLLFASHGQLCAFIQLVSIALSRNVHHLVFVPSFNLALAMTWLVCRPFSNLVLELSLKVVSACVNLGVVVC